MELYFDGYVISDDKTKIDHDAVIEFLSGSYWANKRPHKRTHRAIEQSYCIGVYKDGRQVAFARVVSDYATIY